MTDQRIQQDAICYKWFKQQLIVGVSKPSISQWSQTKRTPSNLLCLPENVTSKHITRHNDLVSLGLEPRLATHCSQPVYCDATNSDTGAGSIVHLK